MAAENPTCIKDTHLERVLQEVSEATGYSSLQMQQDTAAIFDKQFNSIQFIASTEGEYPQHGGSRYNKKNK